MEYDQTPIQQQIISSVSFKSPEEKKQKANYRTIIDLDLGDTYYLTEDKINTLWNLKGRKPVLLVRSKLQMPFIDEEYFESFRDDPVDLIYLSLLPEIKKLRQ